MGRKLARTNLPVERGAFVGRVKLLEEIGRHFDAGQRLITITGPEGIGKTRLGLRAAAVELSRYGQHGGVWYVDVHAAESALGILHAMLLALGWLPEPGAGMGVEQARLVDTLVRCGPTLFLLDGANRCRAELGFIVSQLLPAVVECAFLVTSDKPLGASSEVEVKVGSLKLAKQGSDAKHIAASDGMRNCLRLNGGGGREACRRDGG